MIDPPSAAARAGLSFERLTTGALLLVVFTVGCLMPMQNDSWWHLRVGGEILQLGRVPLADHLSHSAAGRFWPNHEWLAQVIFHGAHRLGGLPLLHLLVATLMTGAWALVASLMEPRWRPLALGLVLPLSAAGWAVRPHLFTFLFVAVMLRLLIRGGSVWLPLLFPVWANLHSGVIIAGPVLVAALVASLWCNRRRVPLLLALLAAWALGCMATPLGPRLFLFVFENLSSPVARQLSEWQPVRLGHGSSMLFVAELLLLLALVALRGRRWRLVGPRRWEDAFLVLVAVGLAVLGLRSVRHIALAAMTFGPALSRLAPIRPAPSRSPSSPERPAVNRALLGGMVLLAAAAIIHLFRLPHPRLGWRPLSPAAAAAITACPDPLYNRYDDGGFLLWFVPGKKVFVDSRHDPYPHQLMLDQFRVQETGDPGALFARHRFRCAVVPPDDLLVKSLLTRGWTASYSDEAWVVLTGAP